MEYNVTLEDRAGAELALVVIGCWREIRMGGTIEADANEPRGDESGADGSDSTHERLAQRLKRLVGQEVDPAISLGDKTEDDEVSTAGLDISSGILKRLEAHGLKQSRYQLKGEIARGGMGAILKVWDEDLRRNVAMKVVLGNEEGAPQVTAKQVPPKILGRFLEEAQVTGQLDHPGDRPGARARPRLRGPRVLHDEASSRVAT